MLGRAAARQWASRLAGNRLCSARAAYSRPAGWRGAVQLAAPAVRRLPTANVPAGRQVLLAAPRRTFLQLPGTERGSAPYREQRLLGFTPEQVFDVVADVGEYKEFLPWCTDSEILSSTETSCRAKLGVGFAIFREEYTSHVTMKRPHLIKAVSHDSNLFEKLSHTWRFSPGPIRGGRPTCRVDIAVSFTFRNPAHAVVASKAFDKVTRKMILAFEQRCIERYGQPAFTQASMAR